MAYYSDLIERIKRDLPIESLLPKEAAGKRSICCPLPDHEDTGPSFTIYRETNSWICWSHPGGQSAGSVLDYLMAERKVEFRAAVEIGAQMLGLEVKPPTEEERQELETWRRREDILTTVARACAGWLQGETEAAQGARAYLERRGFGRDFQRQHLLGLVEIRKLYDIRPKHPGLAGYEPEEYNELGLRRLNDKGEWRRLFYDTRISIPLMRRQRVVGMTFRSLDPDQRAKYIHLPGPAGLYNEDDLHHREVVLTEGVPDCWTLMDWGVPAVGNLGVHAVKHAKKFKRIDTLTLVWDNDEAGRKNVLKTAQAIQSEMQDGEVRILHIPDANDINDWAQAGHTVKEFQSLVDQAPPLLEYMIDQLPDEQAGERLTRDTTNDLNDVLRAVASLSEVQQAFPLKQMAKRLGCSLQSLRRDMTNLVKQDSRIRDRNKAPDRGDNSKQNAPDGGYAFKEVRRTVAALDFNFENASPIGNIGLWLRPLLSGEDEDGDLQECLIECEHLENGPRVQITPYRDRQVDDPKMLRFPDNDLPRWSIGEKHPFSVPRFINDPAGNTPNTCELYRELRKLLTEYIWYPDDHEYDIVSTWIMMTYVYPIFGAVGFLHFNGGKSSGKTLSMDFVERLAFNPRKAESVTEAVLFRIAHNNRSTLILDEAEKFNYPKNGTPEHSQRLLLNGSYKRGATAARINMDTGRSEYFETYSPKCFGSINEIDHVLGDRCIVIRCLKIRKKDALTCLDYAQTDEELQARTRLLRDQLHCWSLTHFPKIRQLFRSSNRKMVPDLIAREREVWIPLITIAQLVDQTSGGKMPSLFELLLKAHKVKLEEKQERERRENLDIIVLQALLDILDDRNTRISLELMNFPSWYHSAKLATEIHTMLSDDGSWPFEKKLSGNLLTRILKKNGIVKDHQIQKKQEGSSRGYAVCVLPQAVQEALSRLRGDGDAAEDGEGSSSTSQTEETQDGGSRQSPADAEAQPPARQEQGSIQLDNDDLPF